MLKDINSNYTINNHILTFQEGTTSIDEFSFLNNLDIKEVIIPDTVTSINDRAFQGCKNIQKVKLSNNLSYLGNSVFQGCESLEEIELPNTLKRINYRTFADCKSLKKLSLEEGLEQIGWGAFYGCEALEEIHLPNHLQTIEHQSFFNCNHLKRITFPDSIKDIPSECFKNCHELTTIIGNNLVNIEKNAFENCSHLTEIPNHPLFCHEESFKNCTSLTSIILHEEMDKIPYGTFDGCTQLKNISCKKKIIAGPYCFKGCESFSSIPSIIKDYEEGAFESCLGIKEVTLLTSTIPPKLFKNCCHLKKITNSYIANEIGAGAFENCFELEEFTPSKELLDIDTATFKNCRNLKFFDFKYILTILDEGFYGCESLEDLNFNNHIDLIGKKAFKNCLKIKKLKIPANLSSFGDEAFYLPFLEYIEVDPNNKVYITTEDHLALIHQMGQRIDLYAIGSKNDTFSCESFCLKSEFLKEIIQPIDGIGSSAFAGSKYLKHLILCSSTVNIEYNAFEDSENLKKLTIVRIPLYSSIGFNIRDHGSYYIEDGNFPFEEVEIIGNHGELYHNAFDSFPNLKNFIIPDNGISTLGQNALSNCHNLEMIYIPNCVTEIREQCFSDNTLIVFENGIKIKGEYFSGLTTRNGCKIIEGKDDTYFVQDEQDVLKITKEEIKKNFKNAKLLLEKPEKIIHWLKNIKEHPFIDEALNNGVLIDTFAFDNMGGFLDVYDKQTRYILENSHFLDEPLSNTAEALIKTPDKILSFIKFAKENKIKDPFLFNQIFIHSLSIPQYEKLCTNFDNNMKRLIQESQLLTDEITASTIMKDMYNLIDIFGGFSTHEKLKQKGITFLTEKIIIDKNIRKEKIHRIFDGIKPREELDYEFLDFFIENYEQLLEEDANWTGFLINVYNLFPDISKTSTSNKGSQRHLKVTIKKCKNYISTKKFKNVTAETYHLAEIVSKWFNDDESFELAVLIYNESLKAPRNIFTKYEITDGTITFDNSKDQDLKETDYTSFGYEWLPKQNAENLILGKYCNCCAHIKGAGQGIMRASMIHPDYQNLVIKNDLNQIIAKFTIYVNREKGYAVFNTAEIEKSYEEKPDELEKIYEAFLRGTEAFIKVYNLNNENSPINIVTIGASFNGLKAIFQEKRSLVSPLSIPKFSDFNLNGYGNYNGDAISSQFLVLKK